MTRPSGLSLQISAITVQVICKQTSNVMAFQAFAGDVISPRTGSRRRVLVPSSLNFARPQFRRHTALFPLCELCSQLLCQSLRRLPTVHVPAGEDSHRPPTCAAFHSVYPRRLIQCFYDVLVAWCCWGASQTLGLPWRCPLLWNSFLFFGTFQHLWCWTAPVSPSLPNRLYKYCSGVLRS